MILLSFKLYDEILTREQAVKFRRSKKEVANMTGRLVLWTALRERATQTLKADKSLTLATMDEMMVFYECVINYRDRLYYDLPNPKRCLCQLGYEIPVITRVLDQLTKRFLEIVIEQG